MQSIAAISAPSMITAAHRLRSVGSLPDNSYHSPHRLPRGCVEVSGWPVRISVASPMLAGGKLQVKGHELPLRRREFFSVQGSPAFVL